MNLFTRVAVSPMGANNNSAWQDGKRSQIIGFQCLGICLQVVSPDRCQNDLVYVSLGPNLKGSSGILVIMAKKSSYIWKVRMVQFRSVKLIKNAPKIEEEKAVYIVESFVFVKRGWDGVLPGRLINDMMGHSSNHLRLLILLGFSIALLSLSNFASSPFKENPGKIPCCQVWN